MHVPNMCVMQVIEHDSRMAAAVANEVQGCAAATHHAKLSVLAAGH
jgi:hypothetical protein